jgi:SAM-dependent methyltransferase
MSEEVARVRALGWSAPAPASDAVIYFGTDPTGISYPGERLAALDGSGYWYRHRGRSVARFAQLLGVNRLWDVGAGAGGMARQLGPAMEEIVTVEPWPAGAQASACTGLPAICGTLDQLGLPAGCLPAVGLFDVLEHVADPGALLAEIRRVLEPDGILLVTVPAYDWLWGEVDDAAGHLRRYTRRSLRRELTAGGFTELRSEYLFATLVVPAALTRALPYQLGRRTSADEVVDRTRSQLRTGCGDGPIDRAARMILAVESAISQYVPLPGGLSVLGAYRPTRS